jgi:hypothetical protein
MNTKVAEHIVAAIDKEGEEIRASYHAYTGSENLEARQMLWDLLTSNARALSIKAESDLTPPPSPPLPPVSPDRRGSRSKQKKRSRILLGCNVRCKKQRGVLLCLLGLWCMRPSGSKRKRAILLFLLWV